MYKLMNSAMMPEADGFYNSRAVSQSEFVQVLRANKFESFIGYQETADFLKSVSGVNIPLSRRETVIQSGDVLLICKLKYRLANPGDKGKIVPKPDDYEFRICIFSAY